MPTETISSKYNTDTYITNYPIPTSSPRKGRKNSSQSHHYDTSYNIYIILPAILSLFFVL